MDRMHFRRAVSGSERVRMATLALEWRVERTGHWETFYCPVYGVTLAAFNGREWWIRAYY